MDSSTGAVTADCQLEFNASAVIDIDDVELDQKPLFELVVRANDSAGITQDMVLHFSIRNLNDEYPQWENEPYSVAVAENTQRGSKQLN